MFLVYGAPGSGKTTLGFQFLMAREPDERVLYISLSETRAELHGVAAAHGWSLEGIDVFDLRAAGQVLGLGDAQTMFDPSDVEFQATTTAIGAELDRIRPSRVVFDSLSELAFLARDAFAFRRQLLMLKQTFMDMNSTVLLLSDTTVPHADRQLHSLAHGVVALDEIAPSYGAERRRIRVLKLRGTDYRGGFHDFDIRTGGLQVYPRLVASEHRCAYDRAPLQSGNAELDDLLGGGLSRGASTLFMGPAGTGKSSMVGLFANASCSDGEMAAVFLFEENRESFLDRSEAMGAPLRAHIDAGRLLVRQVDPAEQSPGEFAHVIRDAVERHGARFIAIDSLNGYIHAMPEDGFLAVQLHELLSYLGNLGVATALVLTQTGLVGPMESPANITYIADSVALLRFFESQGIVRRAVSMLKKRSGPHGSAIREMELDADGLRIGPPMTAFHGVLTGTPTFLGECGELLRERGSADDQ
jgi:circadian clock protein KaiC